jgi:hypothetical protein
VAETAQEKLERQREKCWGMSIGELRLRKELLDKTVRMARADGDVRYEEKLSQLRMMNEVLVAKIRAAREANGIAEPDPVCVGCETLYARVRRKRMG